MNDTPPVCDYEGSDYRVRFWEQGGRDYEDSVERIALRAMMPPAGGTLIDIGAGFGRLADEYQGYSRVVLFDYSRSLLKEARQRIGDDPRFLYVAGDWYRMPFTNGLFDTQVQVRTIHHAADVPALFKQLGRIARPNGTYVLEFANKRNLKAIGRYLLRRQSWSPFAPEPIEFVALNFDFHPQTMLAELKQAGFQTVAARSVSHFRIGFLKRMIPTKLLVGLDRGLQWTGRFIKLTPSIFLHNLHPTNQSKAALPGSFFICPSCQAELGLPDGTPLVCPNSHCGAIWGIDEGVYDFKEPRSKK